MNDWRGKEIKVGSLIIYPRASGSAVELVEGEVVEVNEKSIKVDRTRSSRFTNRWWSDKPVILTVVKNVTVMA